VTTGAGGVGLTLTAASTCVFLQRPWSLVEALQAEDRCHRIGSEIHDCVEIVDIVAANTIDTRVRAVLRDKSGQLADLVQDKRIVAELLGGASVRDLRRKKAS
jgi:SNF2 family DNA or RNA helicase